MTLGMMNNAYERKFAHLGTAFVLFLSVTFVRLIDSDDA
jgi:hypothetical protein